MAKKFSWKRATGLTSAKRKISKATGIPLTKSGRKRKLKKAASCGGCLLSALSMLGAAVGMVVLLISFIF